MANYLSQPIKEQPITSNVNLDLIGKVLTLKQGRYDKNYSEIQKTLDQYGVTNFVKKEDEEYLATKLNEVTNTVNQYGNRDLSRNSVAMDITSKIKNVASDPYILNATEQTQIVRNYEQKAAKDKNFSQDNYNYGLKMGGYDEYISGKAAKLGNLTYYDYIDAPKVLNDEVAKWAKDNGYQKSVTSVDKGYFIQNETREVLSKDDILNFIQTRIDPKIQKQLEINAYTKYGNIPDEDFSNILKSDYERENANDDVLLAEQKAMLRNATGEQLKVLKSNITNLESRVADRRRKINNNDFKRGEQLNIYTKELFNGIAENYERNNLTDISFNDIPLDIAKFEADQIFQAETLKLKRYELDATSIPTIPESDPTKEKSKVDQVSSAFLKTNNELIAVLQNDPTYKELSTKEEKDAHVRTLVKSGGAINLESDIPMSQAVAVAVNNHKSNWDAYHKHKVKVSSEIDVMNRDSYTDMLEGAKKGELNVNNLATTMPMTASALRARKQFKDLSLEQQEVIRYEEVASELKYGSLSDKEEQTYKKYIDNLKQRNAKNPSVLASFNNISQISQPGVLSATGQYLGSYVLNALGRTRNKIAKDLSAVYNQTFYGEDYADKVKSEYDASKEQMNAFDRRMGQQLDTALSNVGREDANISDIGRRDTGSSRSILSTRKDKLNLILEQADEELAPYIPKMQDKLTFSFSTENKAQKPVADVIRQTIIAQGRQVPNLNNNYNIEYMAKENAYVINYLKEAPKGEKGDVIASPLVISAALMPKELRDKFQEGERNWNVDSRNKFANIPGFKYTPPIDAKTGTNMVNKLQMIAPQAFSEQDLYNLKNSPIFSTPSERYEAIYQNYPDIKESQEKIDMVNDLINATINIEHNVIVGQGFDAVAVINYKDGRQKRIKAGKIISEYEPNELVRNQIKVIEGVFNQEVQNIVNQADDK